MFLVTTTTNTQTICSMRQPEAFLLPRPSECTKIVGGWGFAPDPTGELTALPQTP